MFVRKVWPVLIATLLIVPSFSQDKLLGNNKNKGGNSSSGNSSSRDRDKDRGNGNSSSSNRDRDKGNSNSGSKQDRDRGNSNSGSSNRDRDRGNSNSGSRRDDERGNGGSVSSGRTVPRADGNRERVTIDSTPRSNSSRSGRVNYGTNNNMRSANGRERVTINSSPRYSEDRHARRENVRVADRGRHRSGYYHYNSNWRDDYFSYPYYSFEFGTRVGMSPWYLYGHLPGYISVSRINYNCSPYRWNFTTSYNWNDRYYDDRQSDLDNAIDAIVRTFESRSYGRLGQLVERRGRVIIATPEDRPYSISSDDFYDLIVDLASQTRTTDYRITNVWRSGNQVKIEARHDYIDSYGDRRSAFHEYYLERDRGSYRIVQFETSESGFDN